MNKIKIGKVSGYAERRLAVLKRMTRDSLTHK